MISIDSFHGDRTCDFFGQESPRWQNPPRKRPTAGRSNSSLLADVASQAATGGRCLAAGQTLCTFSLVRITVDNWSVAESILKVRSFLKVHLPFVLAEKGRNTDDINTTSSSQKRNDTVHIDTRCLCSAGLVLQCVGFSWILDCLESCQTTAQNHLRDIACSKALGFFLPF